MIDPTVGTEVSLNIDSIKEIMDGFDPAVLLPDLTTFFGKMVLVCRIAVLIGPIILMILGLAYLFAAPKEANYYFGYRCYYGMGSVQAWEFTQRLAGLVLSGLGILLTIIMLFMAVSFGSMDIWSMVWRAVRCMIWEAALTVLATLAINGTVMYWFNGKGDLRRRAGQFSLMKKKKA